MIEAFITWEDGTKSTLTARDYGELFMQINSTGKEMISMDSHLIAEGGADT